MNLNLNVRALRVAYNQFFVNIIELSDAELLSAHFKYVEQIDENEDYLHGNIPVFEILYSLEHMEDIYQQIQTTKDFAKAHSNKFEQPCNFLILNSLIPIALTLLNYKVPEQEDHRPNAALYLYN